MENYNIEVFKTDLKNMLSQNRYEHCLLTANESQKLAKLYNQNTEKAYIAGLLHDIAKEFTLDENKFWVKKYNLSQNLLDPKYSKIIHADIGAIYVKDKYNLDDEICNCIKYHTIGHVPMTTLEKIVFIADKIGRKNLTSFFEQVQKLAYENLDKSLIYFLENEKQYLENKGEKISPTTIKLLNSLKSNM